MPLPPRREDFNKRKPPLPELCLMLQLKSKAQHVSDILAKKNALETPMVDVTDKTGETYLKFGNEVNAIKNAEFRNNANFLFLKAPVDWFSQQAVYFDETIAMDAYAHKRFILWVDEKAKKNGLEVIEVSGREALLGIECPDMVAHGKTVPPAHPEEGVTYYFKSPKGFYSYLYITPIGDDGHYRITGSVEYGNVPSHPIAQISDEQLETAVYQRYQLIIDACNEKQAVRIGTEVAQSIAKDVIDGIIADADRSEVARTRVREMLAREKESKEAYLEDEYVRVRGEVMTELGFGDQHAEEVSRKEINDSLDMMKKIHAATREALIGLNIFESPQARGRRDGNGGPGGGGRW